VSFRNKYLFDTYKDILLNNQMVVFCELNSLNPDYLKKLKISLKKEGFLLKQIKNNVFKKQFQNSNLKNLVNGPVFILYKKTVSLSESFKVLQKFIDYKFILCCFFKNKLYSPLIFKQFKRMISIERLSFEAGVSINTLLSLKLNNTIKQLLVNNK